jgi:S1-C subfamily serine protease
MAELVESAGKSIVRVEGRQRLAASGVVWSAEGVVVTTHHVVERDDNLRVGLPDGSVAAATLVGRDPSTDLAVLRLNVAGLMPAVWLDVANLRAGHLVLAAGRPDATVQATLGVVSALDGAWRTGAGGEIDHYLQTDVVMYPGFSGGPLITASGAFAGVNSSALGRGVSIAVPTGTVKRVVETLLAHGAVPRGYLGVGVQPVRLADTLAQAAGQETGLMVMSVESGGPAAQAGLLQGDVIVTLDGERVQHLDALQSALQANQVGRTVAVRIVRSGSLQDLQATIGRKA